MREESENLEPCIGADTKTRELQRIIDKEAIRDLVFAYSRGVDRKDVALLRDLYTEDSIDVHGDDFSGTGPEFCDYLQKALARLPYCGHHVCNQMLSVEGDEGYGEIYALALHCLPDPDNPGKMIEDLKAVRYLDNYRRCQDGKWRFSRRFVTYDMHIRRPYDGRLPATGVGEPSYKELRHRLFQQGPRA